MSNERVSKNITESKIGGRRKRGRPKVRRMDEDMKDTNELKIKNCGSKAKDRKK